MATKVSFSSLCSQTSDNNVPFLSEIMNMKITAGITHHDATFLSECLGTLRTRSKEQGAMRELEMINHQQRPQVEARLLPVERKLERVGAKWVVGKIKKN